MQISIVSSTEHFHHLKNKPCTISSNPPVTCAQPLVTTSLLSVPVAVPVLSVSHKWNHRTRGSLWPASSILHNVSKVHPHYSICCVPCSFTLLIVNHIPMYRYITFFIHSSAEGHMGCLRVLPTTNNAVNICVQVFAWMYVYSSPGYRPRNELLVWPLF